VEFLVKMKGKTEENRVIKLGKNTSESSFQNEKAQEMSREEVHSDSEMELFIPKLKKKAVKPTVYHKFTFAKKNQEPTRKIICEENFKEIKRNSFQIDSSMNEKKNLLEINSSFAIKMHNHLENNGQLHNKKSMFMNLRTYCEAIKENVYDYVPLTFHIKDSHQDPEFAKFLEYYHKRNDIIQDQEKNPGENKKSLRNI